MKGIFLASTHMANLSGAAGVSEPVEGLLAPPSTSLGAYRLRGRTRARILTAARELLSGEGTARFRLSIDEVSRRAALSRMTVYAHFKSSAGLLEALVEDLADRSHLYQNAAGERGGAGPMEALLGHIAAVGRFWSSSRSMFRRLHALAALDHGVQQALKARYELRRVWLEDLMRRLEASRGGRLARSMHDDAVTTLFTLTSFESFDSLAGRGSIEEAIPLVQRLAAGLEPIWWGA